MLGWVTSDALVRIGVPPALLFIKKPSEQSVGHQRASEKQRGNLLEDSAADADVAGEGALLVNVGAFNGSLGGLEACIGVLGDANKSAEGALGRFVSASTYRVQPFCRI